MKTETLSLFLSIVDTGSISSAAKLHFISQPALSHQIKKLESELNIKLFYRHCSGNCLELSPSGKIFYNHAKKIVELSNKAMIEIQKNSMESNVITIGSGLSGGTYVMPKLIEKCKEYFPDITVNHQMAPGKFLIKNLTDKKYDLIITSLKVKDPKFISTTLFSDPFKCIIPSTSSLKKHIDVKDLFNYPIIIREEGSVSRSILIENMKKCNIKLADFSSTMEVYTNQAIIQAVKSGLGCGFVPKSSIEITTKTDFREVTVQNLPMTRFLNIIKLSETPRNSSIDVFYKFVQSDTWRNGF